MNENASLASERAEFGTRCEAVVPRGPDETA